jgi:hypothetical protein
MSSVLPQALRDGFLRRYRTAYHRWIAAEPLHQPELRSSTLQEEEEEKNESPTQKNVLERIRLAFGALPFLGHSSLE